MTKKGQARLFSLQEVTAPYLLPKKVLAPFFILEKSGCPPFFKMKKPTIKSTSCNSCKTMFSESQEHLPLDTDEAMASRDVIAEEKSFIDAISRGGLVKPSNLLFVTCMYATDLIRYIRKNPSKLSYLFESGDSRAVFIEAFLCKLKESNDTSPIIKARKKG